MEDVWTLMQEALPRLDRAFLMTGKDKPNPMTIGWCEMGKLWNLPMCTVFVRGSRYSHDLIENGLFTVSVPGAGEMGKELAYCGAHSGRDGDKLSALGLSTLPPRVGVPALAQAALHFECRVLLRQQMDIAQLPEALTAHFYNASKEARPDGDPHTIYFGEVVAAYRS